ncbi:MAG: serine hydrolase domain-containing protein [Acidimicrobiales bacterium]
MTGRGNALGSAIDTILQRSVAATPGLPGAAVAVTDRTGPVVQAGAGVRVIGGDEAFDVDTVCALFSATKAITATACLSLVDDGELDLDAPASDYLPVLGELEVLESLGDGDTPVTRPPKRPVTTRHLLLHTAGFGYPMFNTTQRKLVGSLGLAAEPDNSDRGGDPATLAPLLFDPGDRWEYGTGIDWAGRIAERISGQRLGRLMADRIFEPLGMDSTGFRLDKTMAPRVALVHHRTDDGGLEAGDLGGVPDPARHAGGHGLFSTAADYARFIRMWLNDGAGPDGAVIRPGTAAMAFADGLGTPAGGPSAEVHPLPGVLPALTLDADFFPGLPKGWGLSFLLNNADAPTGRPAGSAGWAGMANLFYWIDRRTGIGGIFATQLLPFFDPTAFETFLRVEGAVYQNMNNRNPSEQS